MKCSLDELLNMTHFVPFHAKHIKWLMKALLSSDLHLFGACWLRWYILMMMMAFPDYSYWRISLIAHPKTAMGGGRVYYCNTLLWSSINWEITRIMFFFRSIHEVALSGRLISSIPLMDLPSLVSWETHHFKVKIHPNTRHFWEAVYWKDADQCDGSAPPGRTNVFVKEHSFLYWTTEMKQH